ncbi:MAG: hypothetical protein JWP18_1722 [Solirubrobacterales bacterium]|nr:hypothetical protein [Solirubrobacterales bacterium]
MRRRVPLAVLDRWYDRRLAPLGRPLSVVRPYSLVSDANLRALGALADDVRTGGVPGDFVECGVFQGSSAGVLGHALRTDPDRRLRLFDSFAGMPPAGEEDDAFARQFAGTHIGSERIARHLLDRLGVPREQVEVHVGLFEDTFPAIEHRPVALLHVDCDFHDPVALSLQTFWGDVAPGGVVVLNDYGAFQGCRTAVDAFVAVTPDADSPEAIDHDASLLRKRPAGA